jgi:type IV secretion system protein VirD4
LLLNEAANICPLPSLPALVASGGGRGTPAMVVLQSPGQARHRWGEAQAEALWDAANVKLIFGGLAGANELSGISRLAGDIDEPTLSRTSGAGGDGWSTGIRRVPVLGIEDIRELPEGHAVLFYRHLPPVLVRLSPWWERPIAAQVQASLDATMGPGDNERGRPLRRARPAGLKPA